MIMSTTSRWKRVNTIWMTIPMFSYIYSSLLRSNHESGPVPGSGNHVAMEPWLQGTRSHRESANTLGNQVCYQKAKIKCLKLRLSWLRTSRFWRVRPRNQEVQWCTEWHQQLVARLGQNGNFTTAFCKAVSSFPSAHQFETCLPPIKFSQSREVMSFLGKWVFYSNIGK